MQCIFWCYFIKVENWNRWKNAGIIKCIVSIKELFLAFAKCASNDRKFLSKQRKREIYESQVWFAINMRAESKSQLSFAIITHAQSKSHLSFTISARAHSKSQLSFALNARAQSKSHLYFVYFTHVLSKSQMWIVYITIYFPNRKLSIACMTSVYSNWLLPISYFRFRQSTLTAVGSASDGDIKKGCAFNTI